MCEDCGCSEGSREFFGENVNIELETNILEKNNKLAHDNWHALDDRKIRTINLMSSPGSGKTYLLEKTLEAINNKVKIAVLVGDQQTDNDAKRMENLGAYIKQINTLSSCHLDAHMISQEIPNLPDNTELLIIENIGNLVCPAAFELGEKTKIAMISTTEGEDKPIKYPVLFNKADVVIISKTDLIPYLTWDLKKARNYIKQVNPKAKIIELSAKTGKGMEEWFNYLLN